MCQWNVLFYCAVWSWRVTNIFWPGSYFLIFLSLIRTFLILLYKQWVRLQLLGNRLQCIPCHGHFEVSDNFMQMPSFLFNHKTAAFTLVTSTRLPCTNSHLVIALLFTSIPMSWGFIFHRNKVVDSWKEWNDEHKRFWWAFFSSDLNSSCFTQWWNYLNGVLQLWRERLGSCFWVNKSNLNLGLIGLCLQGSLPKSCWTLRITIWSDLIWSVAKTSTISGCTLAAGDYAAACFLAAGCSALAQHWPTLTVC